MPRIRHHEHYDGGEGEHTGSVLYPTCADRTLHGAADASRDWFAVLRHSLSFLTLCSLLGPTLYRWPVRYPSALTSFFMVFLDLPRMVPATLLYLLARFSCTPT